MDFLKYGNGHPFEESPRAVNHMCHWAPWAHRYQEDESQVVAVLAQMLGYAVEEIDRLRKRGVKEGSRHAKLLFAYIELVDSGKPRPFEAVEEPSVKNAWSSIQQLNRWREENKLNIQEVDVL